MLSQAVIAGAVEMPNKWQEEDSGRRYSAERWKSPRAAGHVKRPRACTFNIGVDAYAANRTPVEPASHQIEQRAGNATPAV